MGGSPPTAGEGPRAHLGDVCQSWPVCSLQTRARNFLTASKVTRQHGALSTMTLLKTNAFLFLLGLDVELGEPSLECSVGHFLAPGPQERALHSQSPESAGRTCQPQRAQDPGDRNCSLLCLVVWPAYGRAWH